MSDIAMKFRSALDAEEYSDVELKLRSGSLLKCHSVVLLMNSDFFRGRLQSRWTTKETPTIDCSMFPDDIVKHLIKFMYGINFPLHMSNIHDTIQCCDYFGASELLDKCVQFLIDGISCDNVFTILMISKSFSLLSVNNKCLEFIDCNMENLLCNFEGFFTLPLALIVQIISRDTLSVHEELLFDHLILWVEQQTVDLEPIWEKLSGHIRFLSMSVEYFIAKCMPLNVLPNEVSNQILMYLTVLEPIDVQGIKVNVVSRCITTGHDILVERFFRKSVDASWKSDAMNGDRINFIVNSGATLKGVSLYGSAGQSFLYTVSLHEAENGSLIQKSKCKLDFVSDVCTFPFKSSCHLAADVTYTLVAIREGPPVFYGVNGVLSNHVHLKGGRKLEIKFEKPDVGSSTIFEEGEQSLMSLKEKFNVFKEKSLKKRSLVHKGSKQPESLSHTLGVQILDKNSKAVKQVFQGPSGFTGIIHITVDGASNSKTWKELVQAKFKNCKLAVYRYEEGVCHQCVNEDKYTISNLLEEKRKKHQKLRCYMMVEGKDRDQIQKCFLGQKSNSSTKGLFTSCSSDVEVELLSAVTKKEEKNVQPSALCKSSTKSAVSSATTVECTSDCVSLQNEDASLELPTESESTQSAVPSPALVEASLYTEQTEDTSQQPSTIPDIESWTKGAASLFSSSLRSTSDVAVSSMENELPHMTFGHRKRQKPLMKVVDRKKMRYDAAKEYLPEVGATDQTRNFVIINGSTNEAMEGQINVAESIKALYSWIEGTIIPENLPAQFELVCMSTFQDMECTDFGCEHSYPLETEAGRTPSVILFPEVLVIKKIGDELDGTLTGFDDVYFSV